MLSTFRDHDRRPGTLVSKVALFYSSGDVGAVATPLETKLAGNILGYVSRLHTKFHAQEPAHFATATPNSFTTKALHPR